MIRICFTHTRISHVLSTRLNEDIDVIIVFPVNTISKHHQPNPARETLLVCHPRRLHEFRASLGEGLATIKSPQFYGLCEREREVNYRRWKYLLVVRFRIKVLFLFAKLVVDQQDC